jgi:ATP-binding cassette subfamily C protein
LIDLPWMLFFILVLFLLHYWLGITVLIGALVLVAITFATEKMTREPTKQVTTTTGQRQQLAEASRRHAEVFQAMGMGSRMTRQWVQVSDRNLVAQQQLTNVGSTLGGSSKITRLFLQSLVLAVGALLVIDNQATGGIIFASSIIAARALAPVEIAIANWRGFMAARQSWGRLHQWLKELPEEAEVERLPAPTADFVGRSALAGASGGQSPHRGRRYLSCAGRRGDRRDRAQRLRQVDPGAWHLRHLAAGARHRPAGRRRARSMVERGSRSASRIPAAECGAAGRNGRREYRPLRPCRRFGCGDRRRQAGRRARPHRAPAEGYQTPVGVDGSSLSAGQRQRIALARALYGDPFLIVLDEPNSNLDADGETALAEAVNSARARGAIVVLVAHRQSILSVVDNILYMRDGRALAYGPKEEVMRKLTGNEPPKKIAARPRLLRKRPNRPEIS